MKHPSALCISSILALSLAGCGPASGTPEATVPPVETPTPSVETPAAPAETPAVTAGAAEPAAQPEMVTVTYYHGDENAAHIVPETAELEVCTPQALLDLLIEENVLTGPVQVNEFSEGQDGVLALDVSQEFADQVRNLGSTGELLTVGSLVNTFLTAYDAESLMLTVEGEMLSTGHMIYEEPISFAE